MQARQQNAQTAQQMYQQSLQQGQLANMQDAMRNQLQQAQLPAQMNTANAQAQGTSGPDYATAVRAGLLAQQYGDIGSGLSKYAPAVQQSMQSLLYPSVASGSQPDTNRTIQFLNSIQANPSGLTSNMPAAQKYLANQGQSYQANPEEQAKLANTNMAVQGRTDVANIRANAMMTTAAARIKAMASKLPSTYQGAIVQALNNKDPDQMNQIFDAMKLDPKIQAITNPAMIEQVRAAYDPMYSIRAQLASQMGGGQQPQQQGAPAAPKAPTAYKTKSGVTFTVQ